MFDFGKNTFLGIDVGSYAIKVVEIKISNGKPVLSNYAWMKLGKDLEKASISSMFFENVLPECVKRVVKEGDFDSEEVNVAIPASGGLITLIEFPEVIKEDLNEAIKFEAHKYIPTALEDVVFSWDIIGKKGEKKIIRLNDSKDPKKPQEEKGKMQVLLVAASKNKVVKYQQLIKKAGLELKSIEIESFSLVRSLVGNDQGNFVIIDIGHKVCNIVLVEKGIIRVNRNIDAGGKEITHVIARSMNVDESKAESLKITGKGWFEKESNLVFPSLSLISGEVTRVINAYYKNEGKTKIDSIILSGGTSGLAGLDKYFQDALGIKTIVGNPFSRLAYDKNISRTVDKIKDHFSVAIGLALRGVEKNIK